MWPTPALSKVTEADYLATSFPDTDPEFREGSLIPRAITDYFHGSVQSKLSYLFLNLHYGSGAPIRALTEVRHRVNGERYLVPDLAVQWTTSPEMLVPDYPPLIAIEVLSPSDTLSAVREKLAEYRDWGVPHVWLIDPHARVFYLYDAKGLHEVPTLPVPELTFELTPAEVFG